MFKMISEQIVQPVAEWCTPKVPCGIFPGVCVTADGTLAMLVICGSGFEAADHRVVVFHGTPDGMKWSECGNWGELHSNDFVFQACAKPTLLHDGTIIAMGYGYEREETEMSLSGYAEKFGHFPKVRNFIAFSADGGRTYTVPQFIEHAWDGIEFSGPAVLLADGRLLAFGPPFSVDDQSQVGLCFESKDNGRTWREKSVFQPTSGVTAWETRGIQLADGRIAVVSWAFDLKTQKHLTNRLAVSADGGETWRQFDTGIRGQAANLIKLSDGKIGILYAKREGDAPGIYLQHAALADDGIKLEECEMLYDVTSGANVSGQILTQFYNLKFGQPSLTHLADGGWLLSFWRKNSSDGYEIVLRKFENPLA